MLPLSSGALRGRSDIKARLAPSGWLPAGECLLPALARCPRIIPGEGPERAILIRTLIDVDYRGDIRFHGSAQRRVLPVEMLVRVALHRVEDDVGHHAVYLGPLVHAQSFFVFSEPDDVFVSELPAPAASSVVSGLLLFNGTRLPFFA